MEIKHVSKSVSKGVCIFCNSQIPIGSEYTFIRLNGRDVTRVCNSCSRLLKLYGKDNFISDYNNWIIIRDQIQNIIHLCKTFNINLDKLLLFYDELNSNSLIYYDKNIYSIIIQYILTFNSRQRVSIDFDLAIKIQNIISKIKELYNLDITYEFNQFENMFIFNTHTNLTDILLKNLYSISNDIFKDSILYYFI